MSLDIFNLPDKSLNTQIFYKSTNWNIPKGVNMIYIFASGGGVGGSGGSSSPGANGTGGNGGNSGFSGRIIIPTSMISNVLQITVGAGGNGGVAGGAGSAGGASTVTSYVGQGTGAVNVYTLINTSDLTGASSLYTSVGLSAGNSASSLGGLSGGVAAAGESNDFGSGIVVSTPFTSGAGGGGHSSVGTNFSGGSILSVGYRPVITGGVSGNINGVNGYVNFTPFFSSGGAGGASNALGTGGLGGAGGIGCGGGGGGSGTVGGAGGKGGDGIVIITCW